MICRPTVGRLRLFLALRCRWPGYLLAVLLAAALLLWPLPALAGGPTSYGARLSILHTGSDSIDLRVETGRPARPAGWLLAAPAGSLATLELLPGEADQLPLTASAGGWLRDQWVIHLRLVDDLAARPDASAAVRVRFHGAPAISSAAGNTQSSRRGASPPADPWFESLLADALLNYEQGRSWRQRPVSTSWTPAAQPLYPPQPRLRLEVPQAGIYRLSGADLLASGWPLDWRDPARFDLTDAAGRSIPLYIAGAADGRLDPQDQLEFYAAASDSRYSASSVFWLDYHLKDTLPTAADRAMPATETEQRPAAAVMPPPAYFPNTIRREVNRLYDAQLAVTDAEGQGWYWQRFTARRGTSITRSFPFTLTRPVFEGDMAQFSARLVPLQAPPYRVAVSLNGHLLLDYLWDPDRGPLPSMSFPEIWLAEGRNQIDLTLTNSGAAMAQSLLLDWFEISYNQGYVAQGDWAEFSAPKSGMWTFRVPGFSSADVAAYDVTTPQRPRRLVKTGAEPGIDSYTLIAVAQGSTTTHFVAAAGPALRKPQVRLVAPSAALAPQAGADWLALASPDLLPALAPLVDRRAGQGLRTRVIDPQVIYDAYAGGLAEPAAITAFLADAYANWPGPPPAFVLLVGDGSYDPRGYLAAAPAYDIPALLETVDPVIGQTADENGLAAVRGDDPLPDLALGRLPVASAAELEAVVSKILAYEDQPLRPGANWPPQHFFLADNPDLGGDFHLLANAVSQQLPRYHRSAEAHFGVTPYLTPGAAQAATIDALNNGLLLLHYVGHGTPDAWAGERLLGPEHIPLLTNAAQAPPALSMSSLNGYFLDPHQRSFLEQMLVAANGGISAYVASTGVGASLANYVLHQGFVQQVTRRSPPLLGLGFVRGKLALFADGPSYARWLMQAFALFGDPAQRLPLRPNGLYLPLVDVRQDRTLYFPR